MTAHHLEFLVEEPSMEAFLRTLLPQILRGTQTFEIHPFQGKKGLLSKLRSRLRAYSKWIPNDWRIVVLVDRDDDNCIELKHQMEQAALQSGVRSRSQAEHANWQIVNRIVIEELEAWYFGDWRAVCSAYPKLPKTIPNREAFRNPDAIQGGTWEAFERILKRHKYFLSGLRKVEAARKIGGLIDPTRQSSISFIRFYEAILEACA